MQGKFEAKKVLECKQMCDTKLKDNVSLWNLNITEF